MTIENRNLEAGTKLVGGYKKQAHFAEVVKGEDGSIGYRLDDGQTFTSLSAAGSAVMAGVACNGWRFWSLVKDGETEAEAGAREKPKAAASRGRKKAPQSPDKIIRRTENQEGLAEGQVRYFCAACLETFIEQGDQEPQTCPAGHRAEAEPVVAVEAGD